MIDVPQTRRMACAIIANALVFHEHIAGMHPEVKPLAKVCGDGVDNPQGEVLAAWDDILSSNYWAIFAIAKDIMEQLPSGDAADILRRLRHTAQSVNATWVDNAHGLTGRSHLNLDFTFGSQALAVAFTDAESIGGRVWPNVIFSDKQYDYAFSVWGNSTLGLLSYWWHSNRQQSSKAGMTIRSAGSLQVLDLRALTDEQLRAAEAIFNEFRDKELKPAYLVDADANRALLDKRVVCNLLGFDENVYVVVRYLAAKWCAEPSVHGGKARPKAAQLVI